MKRPKPMIRYGHLLLNIKNNMKHINTYGKFTDVHYKIFESEDFDIEEKINKIFNIDEEDY